MRVAIKVHDVLRWGFNKVILGILYNANKTYNNWKMDSEVGNVLSPKEQEVMANILSIQHFYHLKDHLKLISIIINKK